MLLHEPIAHDSYEYAKTDPNDYTYTDSGSFLNHSFTNDSLKNKHDLVQKQTIQKKKSLISSISSSLEPRHFKSPTHQKKRCHSNERSAGATLDQIFGGDFKVVDIFSTENKSKEHFPDVPTSHRFSSKKQNNFEIVEADEEEEDVRESRNGHRSSTNESKSRKDSHSEFRIHAAFEKKTSKQEIQTSRDFIKTSIGDDKDDSFRIFYQKKASKPAIQHAQAIKTTQCHFVDQLSDLENNNFASPQPKKPHLKARKVTQSTFYKESNSFYTKECMKGNDSFPSLPQINNKADDSHHDMVRGRKMNQKEFYNTQVQFARPHLQLSPDSLGNFEALVAKRNEKENKYKNQKSLIDAKYEGVNLIEKYANRFQLSVDEVNIKKTKVEREAKVPYSENLGLMISTARISTPYKTFNSDLKTDTINKVRNMRSNRIKTLHG